jgi:ribosomal protein L3
MSAELELVVRRDHGLFIPSYHVTVMSTGPVSVAEVFDVQTHGGVEAAAQYAMDQLRPKGYRLTAAVEVHQSEQYEAFATAPLVRDEERAATVVLAGDLMQDARQIVKALASIETREGAKEVVRVVADLMANAQALKARADAVLSSDRAVESAAILDDVVTEVGR